MNRQYDTDDEEFGVSNELDLGYTEPYSVLLTPKKEEKIVIHLIFLKIKKFYSYYAAFHDYSKQPL